MNDPNLTVLLLESAPGAGTDAAARLEEAGHRVLRCTGEGSGRHGLPCVGMLDPSACPLEQHVDVALVRRAGVVPWPTGTERGVVCAIRDGVPVVEDGDQVLDPYERWLAARVDGDVVATCEEVAGRELADIADAAVEHCLPLLASAGLRPDVLACRIERRPDGAVVHLSFDPSVAEVVRQAAAVRAADAVRTMRGRGPVVDVVLEDQVPPAVLAT